MQAPPVMPVPLKLKRAPEMLAGFTASLKVIVSVVGVVATAPVATDKTISYTMDKNYNFVEILPTDVGGDSDTTFDQGATTLASFTTTAGALSSLTPLTTKIILDFGATAPASSFTFSVNYRLKNSVGSSNVAKVTVNVTKAQ